MNTVMVWLILTWMIITSIAFYFITSYAGKPLYPPEVLELHFAFFWFSGVFYSLSHTIFDIGSRQTRFEQMMKGWFGYMITAHVISALVLRFALGWPILLAYGWSFAITVFIPAYGGKLVFPLWERAQQSQKVSNVAIKNAALKNETVKKFLQHYQNVNAFIFNNRRDSDTAVCVFSTRFKRDERPGLYEDRCVEVPIALETLTPEAGKERLLCYIFEVENDESVVMQLEPDHCLNSSNEVTPLSQDQLIKFDQMFAQHPDLTNAPLPVVNRAQAFEMIEIEDS